MEDSMKEKLTNLYEERLLLKHLIGINPSRYGYLNPRVAEIKMIINSEYIPHPTNNLTFITHSLRLTQSITKSACEYLKDIQELINEKLNDNTRTSG